jgi:hypothetical protein
MKFKQDLWRDDQQRPGLENRGDREEPQEINGKSAPQLCQIKGASADDKPRHVTHTL